MDPDSLDALRRTLERFLKNEDPCLVQDTEYRVRRLIECKRCHICLARVLDLKDTNMHTMELFANELAHITDPYPANWRVVPLCQTEWYNKDTPQEYATAFTWTVPACRTTFLVYFDPNPETWRIFTSTAQTEEQRALEQSTALQVHDVIRTYTIYDTPTDLDTSMVWNIHRTVLMHFISRELIVDTVILMDEGLKTPDLAEPFFKCIAMIIDPVAATTAWNKVPLCHTHWFNQNLPQHMQLAVEWTSQRYGLRLWVYPSLERGEYKWIIYSTPFGTPDQERALEEDKALAHAIRTFTWFDTQSDDHASLTLDIVYRLERIRQYITDTEKSLSITDADLKSRASKKPFFTCIARIMDQNAQNLTWGLDMRGRGVFSWYSPRYDRDFFIFIEFSPPEKTYMLKITAPADAISETGTVEHEDYD